MRFAGRPAFFARAALGSGGHEPHAAHLDVCAGSLDLLSALRPASCVTFAQRFQGARLYLFLDGLLHCVAAGGGASALREISRLINLGLAPSTGWAGKPGCSRNFSGPPPRAAGLRGARGDEAHAVGSRRASCKPLAASVKRPAHLRGGSPGQRVRAGSLDALADGRPVFCSAPWLANLPPHNGIFFVQSVSTSDWRTLLTSTGTAGLSEAHTLGIRECPLFYYLPVTLR